MKANYLGNISENKNDATFVCCQYFGDSADSMVNKLICLFLLGIY